MYLYEHCNVNKDSTIWHFIISDIHRATRFERMWKATIFIIKSAHRLSRLPFINNSLPIGEYKKKHNQHTNEVEGNETPPTPRSYDDEMERGQMSNCFPSFSRLCVQCFGESRQSADDISHNDTLWLYHMHEMLFTICRVKRAIAVWREGRNESINVP